jgi:hypothetical protein
VSPIATRDITRGTRVQVPFEWWWIAVGVVAVVSAVALLPALRLGSFVAEVRLDNPSEFDVMVDAAPAPGDGWMPVGSAPNRHTTLVQDVYDLGDVWYFRVSTPYARADVRMTRAELERARWTVRVPPELVEQLRKAGADPAPARSNR